MERVSVVIVVEHKNRELESACLLKVLLRKRGITAAIVYEGWNEGPMSVRLHPELIVLPWCYDDDDVARFSTYQSANKNGVKLLNSHCEQITSSDSSELAVPTGRASQSYHLCWGDYFKDRLLQVGIQEETIRVVGSPRLDFFREELRDLSSSREYLSKRFCLDSSKHWILIIGGFSAAFLSDERVDELKRRGFYHASENSALARKAFSVISSWLRAVIQKLNNRRVEIIYRPHPSEPGSDIVESIAKDNSSFHIIKELPIRDWLINADAAYMWNSTSSVEAAYAGTPVFSMCPVDMPDYFRYDMLKHVPQIYTAEDLLRSINSVLDGRVHGPDDAFLNDLDYYYRCLNRLSSVAIADYVEDILCDETGVRYQTTRPRFYGVSKHVNYWIKLGLLKLGLMRRIPRFRILADDYVSSDEERMLEKRIATILCSCDEE